MVEDSEIGSSSDQRIQTRQYQKIKKIDKNREIQTNSSPISDSSLTRHSWRIKSVQTEILMTFFDDFQPNVNNSKSLLARCKLCRPSSKRISIVKGINTNMMSHLKWV